MKIAVVNGTMRSGSTRHITQMFLDELGGDVTEFWLPRDFSKPCLGCFSCFENGEETCPHADDVEKILCALDEADLVILQSPVYVLGMSGQLKCFLDHTGFRFMVHRPNPEMYRKTGLVVSTAGGAGTRAANKAMKACLTGICIPRVYRYGVNVFAMDWEQVAERKKRKIKRQVRALSRRVQRRVRSGKVGSFSQKLMFYLMRSVQKKNDYLPKDREYWIGQGWLGKERPWKS